jgi:TRAP-type mannitol/chloroaromatic compound transport system permease large subunit
VKRGVWFGLSLMAVIVLLVGVLLPPPSQMGGGHLGLLMLALIVVVIMLGFPTAFTLMGMGMFFGWLAYDYDIPKILDLMVQRTFLVMTNDVLISIPLFVFMGYVVERANIVDKLFRSLHLALSELPGSLAVATLITCAIFATATGIVGAVVTLMGLLAFPAMLRHGYSVKLSAGAITAGGCLGILIPPSIMLIVYGATAGVSVVKLYAGAFLPGLMLTALYVGYVIVLAKLRPRLAPPLAPEEKRVPAPAWAEALTEGGRRSMPVGLLAAALAPKRHAGAPQAEVWKRLAVAILPPLTVVLVLGMAYWGFARQATQLDAEPDLPAGIEALGDAPRPLGESQPVPLGGLAEPPAQAERPPEPLGAVQEPVPSGPAQEAAPQEGAPLELGGGAGRGTPAEAPLALGVQEPPAASAAPAAEHSGWQGPLAVIALLMAAVLLWFYWRLDWKRLEVGWLLLTSFFPLTILILAVLGSIVFGLATPSEAAAIGSVGGIVLALSYRQLSWGRLKESVFLTARTSAMVCWLFVGSSIFSAAFALLGGQELIEKWVLSLDLTPIQFMLLSQVIIFLLGWPLEWTEIIVIFMPIFIPLLGHFDIDPLFFGLLVALNLQTAFLSPPVAMAAFYLKGVAPPHVTLNQIFVGMLPFMGLQLVALALLYAFPEIGLWLPNYLYK